MRYYNNTIASLHRKDMTKASSLLKKQDPLMHHLLKWVPKIVININREYASAGTLDLNDLIAMGNYHLINAVNNINWHDEIKMRTGEKVRLSDIPQAEIPAVIWAYVKKSVVLKVGNEINYAKDGVRTNRVNGMPMVGAPEQDFVTELFPDFFDEQFLLYHDNTDTMWDIIQLGIGLDEAMDKVLSFDESKIIKMVYGIDQEKRSYEEISKKFYKLPSAIRKIKQRAVDKLKLNEDDVKLIIQKYYDF